MADRSISIRISATDSATAIFDKVGKAAKQLGKDVDNAYAGPAVKSRFGRDESEEDRAQKAQLFRSIKEESAQAERDAKQEQELRGKGIDKGYYGEGFGADATREADRIKEANKQGDGEGGGIRDFVRDANRAGKFGDKLAAFGTAVHEATSEFAAGKITQQELRDKMAGAIPVIGGFWQAGRELRGAIDDLTGVTKAAIRREEAQDNRDTRGGIVDKREAARGQISTHLNQAADQAELNDRIVGKRGTAAARQQVENDYQNKLEAIENDKLQIQRLDPKDQEGRRQQIEQRRLDAVREHNVALQKIDEESLDKTADLDNDARAQRKAVADATGRELLETAGRYNEAKIAAIQQGTAAELEELDRRHEAEIKDQDPKGIEVQQADDRLRQGKKAAIDKQTADLAKAKQDADREEADREFDHQQQIKDVRVSYGEQLLEADNRHFSARTAQIKAAYQKEEEQAKHQAEVLKRTHADQAKDIDRQRDESISAARDQRDADLLAAQVDAAEHLDHAKLTASSIGMIGGDANALSALAAPVAAKESEAAAGTREIRQMKEMIEKKFDELLDKNKEIKLVFQP